MKSPIYCRIIRAVLHCAVVFSKHKERGSGRKKMVVTVKEHVSLNSSGVTETYLCVCN